MFCGLGFFFLRSHAMSVFAESLWTVVLWPLVKMPFSKKSPNTIIFLALVLVYHMDMSLCGGCVVCLSCYSTLIKILVLFSLVYINSLGVSEHICHRFWRLMILKREKIPLFIMVSLMWFPCAADKGEISRWCKTSLVISRQHYQVYMFFLTAA